MTWQLPGGTVLAWGAADHSLAQSRPQNKTLKEWLHKVGPKGYIHGWIYVGPPGMNPGQHADQLVGTKVTHPSFGTGTITSISEPGDQFHVGVTFPGGEKHQFEYRAVNDAEVKPKTLQGLNQRSVAMRKPEEAADAAEPSASNLYEDAKQPSELGSYLRTHFKAQQPPAHAAQRMAWTEDEIEFTSAAKGDYEVEYGRMAGWCPRCEGKGCPECDEGATKSLTEFWASGRCKRSGTDVSQLPGSACRCACHGEPPA